MTTWSSLGPLLALDNVAVALALAPICGRAGRLGLLAAWFAGVEAAAPLLGALLHASLPASAPSAPIATVLTTTLGLSVLGLSLVGRDAARLVASGAAIAALAVLLGIDNFLAGAAVSVPVALASGLAGAGTVLAACGLGRLASRHLSSAGCAALAAALLLGVGVVG